MTAMRDRFIAIMVGYVIAAGCLSVGFIAAEAGIELGTILLVAFGGASISYVALEVAIALLARAR